jgi:enolase
MAFSSTTRKPVAEYLEGDVHDMMQDALNACYVAQAPNAGQFMARYLQAKYATALVDKVECFEQLDGTGSAALAVRVSLYDGTAATVATSHGNGAEHPSSVRQRVAVSDKDTKARFGGNGFAVTGPRVAATLTQVLTGSSVHDQRALDAAVVNADGTENLAVLGCNVVAAVSACIATASAAALKRPLFLQLAAQFHDNRTRPAAFHLPQPMVAVIGCDPKHFGRVRIREVCVTPNPATPIGVALQQCARVVEEAATVHRPDLRGLPTLAAHRRGQATVRGSDLEDSTLARSRV